MPTQFVESLGSETRDNESEIDIRFIANKGRLGKKKGIGWGLPWWRSG